MAKDIPDQIRAIADALLGWRATKDLGATDVLAWWRDDRLLIGFRGPALQIESRALRGEFDNRSHQLEASLLTALGQPMTVEYWPGSRKVRDISPRRMDAGMVGAQVVLDGVERTVDAMAGDEISTCVLLPDNGAPWNVGDRQTPYYSARRRKILFGSQPAGLVDVVTRDHGHMPGVDFCTIAPAVRFDYGGIVGVFRGRAAGMGGWLVTHSFSLGGRGPSDQTSDSIRGCGGLLYPSLAVGMLPASKYGSCCLFARLRVALQGLKPYKTRARGPWPVVTYATDAATETTTSFKQDASHELFQQLTGGWSPDYSSFGHMYVLGPAISTQPWDPDAGELKIATSTAEVARVLSRRAKAFRRDMSQDELVAIQQTPDRFPYLESKVNGVLSLDETVPLAACAEHEQQEASAFLRRAGYKGMIISVPQSDKERKALESGEEWAQYDYSWRLRDLVMELAKAQPAMIEEVLT